MTNRRYLLLFVIPYAVLVLVLIIGYAWTAAQEREIRANAAHFDRLQEDGRQFIREQCVLDQITALKTVPHACDLIDAPQPEENP